MAVVLVLRSLGEHFGFLREERKGELTGTDSGEQLEVFVPHPLFVVLLSLQNALVGFGNLVLAQQPQLVADVPVSQLPQKVLFPDDAGVAALFVGHQHLNAVTFLLNSSVELGDALAKPPFLGR